MPKAADIPFRQIPRQSALFLKYLDLSPNALRFYRSAPTMNGLEETARSTIAAWKFPRKEIASILRRQSEAFGTDPATLTSISELEAADTVTVLTGQQVGLFGGPLYTVYKAITAINLAADLRARGIRAVPIFWMDTEDHDLAEVTHCTIRSGSGMKTVDYRNTLFGEFTPAAVPVGSVIFPESIQQALEDYIRYLPDSKWKPEVRSRLESAYKPGSSFGNSFASLMSRIFAGSGLIFFDPQDPNAKRLSSRVFQRALREADTIYSALIQRKQELESSGFHAQVNVLENSTVLFFSSDGRRRALERRPSGFIPKGGDRLFSFQEMLESANLFPEKFSPNVLLRPLVQDHLFPTVAYAGGSSEVAYFAQIEVLYNLFGRPMPVIWPRNSFTLLEDEVGAEMDRFGISVWNCFDGKQSVTESAIRNSGFSKATNRVVELQDRLDQVLTEVRPGLESVEPPLGQALETARRKITHNLQFLKSRLVHFEAAQNSTLPGAIDLIMNNCFPNQNLQEREFGVHQFLACHGLSLLDVIRSASEVANFSHRVLRLQETI
jgi:bacillithiol synthase